MRIQFTILLLISSFIASAQNADINLIFKDNCSNKIISPDFEIDSLPGTKNFKLLIFYIDKEDLIAQENMRIDLRKIPDTIYVPKILIAFGNELHTSRWEYLNCDKVANGLETDYYQNGEKRLEGNFKNGKPEYIKRFRENGTIEIEEIYNSGTLDYKRINYFDQSGELEKYEIYKNKTQKTIIKIFDKNDQLIDREIQKHTVVRNK